MLAQTAAGTPAPAALLWVAVVAIGGFVPGVAVVRAVRRDVSSLADDLGWGAVAAVPVLLLGWVAWQGTGVPPAVWGPVVVAALLVVPRTRTRLTRRPVPAGGHGPTWALLGCLLVAVAWTTGEFLRWIPADPGAGYLHPDLLFQVALVGEASHAMPPTNPTVAGQPLDYHWFTHAVAAQLAAAAGLELALVTLRLLPVTIVLGTTLAARPSPARSAAERGRPPSRPRCWWSSARPGRRPGGRPSRSSRWSTRTGARA